MIGAYPFRIGDELRVSVRASTTTGVILFARIRYDDGTDDLVELDITHSSGDRSNQIIRSADLFKKAGWVEHLTIDTSLNNARGQFYMMVAINKEPHHFPIAAGYIDIPHVPLGEFEPAIGGSGYLRWVDIVADVAGNVVTEYNPAAANARRIIYAIMTYLNADGNAANRDMRLQYNPAPGTLPTGFTGGDSENVYRNLGPGVISATQEGAHFVGDRYSSENDNGTVTVHDSSVEPSMFPVTITKDMTDAEFEIEMVAGLAGDRYSSYALIEEWIEP